MRFGIPVANFGSMASRDHMLAIASTAEELGYNSLWVAERLLVPIPPNQPWSRRNPTAFEPLVTLSHLAAATTEIHLGTSVVILPVRNPVLLARMAASLDVLSQGRLELGVGIGWMREEMEVSGVPFRLRGRMADEYIQAMRHLWKGRGYKGEFVSIPPNLFQPKPVRGEIPIWVGGDSDAALRRAARLGDGWIPMGTHSPEGLRRSAERISEMAAEAGREGIEVSCNQSFTQGSLKHEQACIDLVESFSSAGATQLIPRFQAESLPELVQLMEAFAQGVLPSFS